MTDTTTSVQGLLIATDHVREITLDSTDIGRSLRQHIGCDVFEVVALAPKIDVFVDEEGLLRPRPVLNLPLTVIAHRFGAPTVIFGNGVIVGIDDATDETVSLTAQDRDRVLQAMRERPGPVTLERLYESLAPLPGIVELLRANT